MQQIIYITKPIGHNIIYIEDETKYNVVYLIVYYI